MHKCTKCKKERPLDKFGRRQNRTLKSHCIDCAIVDARYKRKSRAKEKVRRWDMAAEWATKPMV